MRALARYQVAPPLGAEDYEAVPGSRKDNAARVEDQLLRTPEWSNCRIGLSCAVDHKTVAAARRRMETAQQIAVVPRVVSRNGKLHPSIWHRPAVRFATTEMDRRFASDGAIYLCGFDAGTVVKIGWARDPWARVKSLQTASPEMLRLVLVIPGSRNDEAAYHAMFAGRRRAGEWFQNSDDVVVQTIRRDLHCMAGGSQ